MKKDSSKAVLIVDRRSPRLKYDRRSSDRRKSSDDASTLETRPDRIDQRHEDRRKVERRRQIDPTTCERDYSQEEIEFMKAIDDYKRRSGRQFPTWSEVLEVFRDLGYRKVAEPSQTYHAQPVNPPHAIPQAQTA